MSLAYLRGLSHAPKPMVVARAGEPSAMAMLRPEIHKKRSGRGADLMFTEDEVYPTKTHPGSMDFDAPLHLPQGTAVRTDVEFWGPNPDLLMERRPLLPSYVLEEHEWDRNPRECGLKASYVTRDPYSVNDDAVDWAQGATLAKSVDVKELGNNRYFSFTQKTNPTVYGADPVVGNGSGGMGPSLGPYLGKKGMQPKPTVPDRAGGMGGAMVSAPPKFAEFQLPPSTRSGYFYEVDGTVQGGYVADYGDETINPVVGGRQPLWQDYEQWGQADGGYVASGNDLSINDPRKGMRMRKITEHDGGYDPIIQAGCPAGGFGPSLDTTPVVGGRARISLNFDTTGNGGASAGMRGTDEHNPVDGGRARILVNYDTTGNGGSTSGMRGTDEHNPVVGGRIAKYINFNTIGNGGATSGVRGTDENNPIVGGRIAKYINFDTIGNGGAISGVSGIECSDITGGNRWSRTEGVVGRVPLPGFQNQDYGGTDVAFGLQVGPRQHRTEQTSIMIPGASGHGGDAVIPEQFMVTKTTEMNASGSYDDTPDPIFQLAARRTLGAHRLLDFSKANLDDLSFERPC